MKEKPGSRVRDMGRLPGKMLPEQTMDGMVIRSSEQSRLLDLGEKKKGFCLP